MYTFRANSAPVMIRTLVEMSGSDARTKSNNSKMPIRRRLSVLCTVASACFHAADSSDHDIDRRNSSNKSIFTPTPSKKKKRTLTNECRTTNKRQRLANESKLRQKKIKKKVTDHTPTDLKRVGAVVVTVEDSPILAKACVDASDDNADDVHVHVVQAGHRNDGGGDDVVSSVTDEESSIVSLPQLPVVDDGCSSSSSRSNMERHRCAAKTITTATTATVTTTSSQARNYRYGSSSSSSSSSNIRSWHRPLPFPQRLPKPFEATGRNGGKKTLGPITSSLA